jgi:diaminopimelate epimerase
MKRVLFRKYQATGNDFVIFDNRKGDIALSTDQIQRICDRRFGIGADGLILLENDTSADFKVVYYNSDGSQSLCGNGSRAAVQMASSLGMINGKATFSAYDGVHNAAILPDGVIRIQMKDVTEWQKRDAYLFLNTGSPHVVKEVEKLREFPVVKEGKSIRYSEDFKPSGTNVNFIELLPDNTVFVRTYERGVEDETLSCGTGVTAVALAAGMQGYQSPVSVQVMGGKLSVEFKYSPSGQSDRNTGAFTDIFLVGPAKLVFEGELDL